jgi:cell division protein FtsN
MLKRIVCGLAAAVITAVIFFLVVVMVSSKVTAPVSESESSMLHSGAPAAYTIEDILVLWNTAR